MEANEVCKNGHDRAKNLFLKQGVKRCRECDRLSSLRYYYRHKEARNAKTQADYRRRRAAGRCARCPQPAKPDYIYCEHHLRLGRIYTWERNGLPNWVNK